MSGRGLSRRDWLRVAAASLAASTTAARPALAASAYAGGKSVRIVVPFAPGGAPDILARLFAQEMGAGFATAFVDNKPGAGGNVGADAVAKSARDGATLLLTTTATQSINPALYPSMPYDAARDFTAVSLVAYTPLMLAVGTASPIKSVADLIAVARRSPGDTSYASAGIGTMQHIAGELFSEQSGVRMTHVPYKGTSLALPDLMTGRVTVMFNSTAAFAPLVKEGKLRPIAVTTKARLPGWKDVPTVAESGLPGFEASAWYAFFGPAGLDPSLVAALSREIARIVDLPATRERYAQLGLEPAHSTPAELEAIVKADLAKWSAIIKAKQIKPE